MTASAKWNLIRRTNSNWPLVPLGPKHVCRKRVGGIDRSIGNEVVELLAVVEVDTYDIIYIARQGVRVRMSCRGTSDVIPILVHWRMAILT